MKPQKTNKNNVGIHYVGWNSKRLSYYYARDLLFWIVFLAILLIVLVPIIVLISRLELSIEIKIGIFMFLIVILIDVSGRIAGFNLLFNPLRIFDKKPVQVYTFPKGLKGFKKTLFIALIFGIFSSIISFIYL